MAARFCFVAGLVLLACRSGAPALPQAPEARPSPSISSAPPAPAPEQPDVPAARSVEETWMSLQEWRERHQRQLSLAGRGEAQVVFLGDSITEGWQSAPAYEQAFAGHRPLNLGIGGDQTQHLLWRIQDGALEGVEAPVAVVMIGVNNLGNGMSPEQTLRGVRAVVGSVRKQLPHSQLLLLAILPAGQTAEDPLRQKIVATNRLLVGLTEPGVEVQDVGQALLEPDGSISASIMADYLHPTALGYERLTAAVAPLAEAALGRGSGG